MSDRKFVPTSIIACPACDGDGYVIIETFEGISREHCHHCKGRGKVQEYAEITSLGDAANAP